MSKRIGAVSIVAGLIALAMVGWACTAAPTPPSELVAGADLIVRAEVEDYATPPPSNTYRTNGVAKSTVRFNVLEILRGSGPSEVVLPGYVVHEDDFNDHPSPYTFVRPGGRSGSCYANSYRQGAEYLLFLRKTPTGDLTVNWAPLSPVNEQLHSGEDPWLLWVRQQVAI